MKYRKPIIIGLILALLVNVAGSVVYTYFISSAPLMSTLKVSFYNGALVSIIGFGALPNLGLFFLFLKNNRELRARGVVLASIISAIVMAIIKFT